MMKIEEFVEKAKKQDDRNIFSICEDLTSVPAIMKDFYKSFNPVDVEVNMNGNFIRFSPFEKLDSLQSEYALKDGRFVFATCNGDPIYLFNDKVYSCYHGTDKITDELMSESFLDFLGLIE